MKPKINTVKSQKKKKKNFDKIKQLGVELLKIKFANNPNKLQSELKELHKIQVIDKNLHEIKQEILVDYTEEFEMVGNLKTGDEIGQTHIGFINMDDFESYINAIDEGYEAREALFSGFIYKLNTP